MSDFTEKNIEDVRPGDEIIGFDEYPLEKGKKRKFVKAKIVDCGYTRSLLSAYEYRINGASVLEASDEHPVLTNDDVFETTGKIFESDIDKKYIYIAKSVCCLSDFKDGVLKDIMNVIDRMEYHQTEITIVKIEYDRPKRFFNLTTTSHTFIANKILVHNCYEIAKKNRGLDFEYAKKFVDIILTDPDPLGVEGTDEAWLNHKSIIFDFIGGDSFMQIDLLDRITNYIVWKLWELDHRFKDDFYFSLSSNGTLFSDERVRNWIMRWKDVLSLGVSIDGHPIIHDKYRIFSKRGENGEELGSMPEILKWWNWYKETLPSSAASTKATCARDSIPYLLDSLQFMHEDLGIIYINQNFIMENSFCNEKDYILLEDQLRKCVNYVLDHDDQMYWSLIDKNFVAVKSDDDRKEDSDKSRCGSGSMPALSLDGVIYPCFRWLPMTQKNKDRTKDYIIGDINNGLYHKEKGRIVSAQTPRAMSTERCLNCKHCDGCPYCIAGCFCEFGKFKRTEYVCDLWKLQVKFSNYYWEKYYRKHPEKRNESMRFEGDLKQEAPIIIF